MDGGVASGFKHVDPNHYEKKLLQIKGKRNIRVRQVIFRLSKTIIAAVLRSDNKLDNCLDRVQQCQLQWSVSFCLER